MHAVARGNVNKDLTVSVIIATKNRATTLAPMLETLLAQTIAAEEIIIVDQSSNQETKKIVEAASHKSCEDAGTRFLYTWQPALTGAGIARNRGIEMASGAVLVFLDDDVLLEPPFLQEVIRVYDRDPQVGGVSGIIVNYKRPPFRERLLEQVFCVGPFRDERLPLYWNAGRLNNSEPIAIRKMSGCVMSVRRTALGNHRFDENYRGAGAEDVDLSWRVSETSAVLLTPRARLTHLRTTSGPKRDHWLFATVSGQHYLYQRLWRTGFLNRLCFAWFNLGLIMVASLSSLRRRSWEPFRALRSGIRRSREFLRGSAGTKET